MYIGRKLTTRQMDKLYGIVEEEQLHTGMLLANTGKGGDGHPSARKLRSILLKMASSKDSFI